MSEIQQQQRGFSKALKAVPIRIDVTVTDPEYGTPIRMVWAFRRMTDGEVRRVQSDLATRKATHVDATMADLIDILAPLFRDVKGVDDFPSAAAGTPAARFQQYFGGLDGETEEDLEVEGKILQACYLGVMQGTFRLIPAELVQTVSLLLGRDGQGVEVASDTGGAVV